MCFNASPPDTKYRPDSGKNSTTGSTHETKLKLTHLSGRSETPDIVLTRVPALLGLMRLRGHENLGTQRRFSKGGITSLSSPLRLGESKFQFPPHLGILVILGQTMKVLRFPEGFEWGTATAAFQIEGSKGGKEFLKQSPWF